MIENSPFSSMYDIACDMLRNLFDTTPSDDDREAASVSPLQIVFILLCSSLKVRKSSKYESLCIIKQFLM